MRFCSVLALFAVLWRPASAENAPRPVAILPLDVSRTKMDEATRMGLDESKGREPGGSGARAVQTPCGSGTGPNLTVGNIGGGGAQPAKDRLGLDADIPKGPPKLFPGHTTVIGGLTPAEVVRVIRRHGNEIKFCYEKQLTKGCPSTISIAVDFKITSVGDVRLPEISESTFRDKDFETCLLDNIRRWKFPVPRGDGTVRVQSSFIVQAQQ